ncbi:MBL fold metallo-hydrolase [Sphingobacterium deserti]|uniref:Outer membrane protein n=1 Tax=Sphingobacterium deserti TaxID=1229276 RepID=A0A0B8T756_9SPHI|nr:MBL fold metallo-hydrolase [Sphingobacterium deserti]KGE13460.1 outer membrane protein [Sphingobacterium deserti]
MTSKTRRIVKYTAFGIGTIALVGSCALAILLNGKQFGKLPEGARLERIRKSPHYIDGEFKNSSPTALMTGEKSRMQNLWDFMVKEVVDLIPAKDIPATKTTLSSLPLNDDLIVWLGHSSLFIQLDGKRIVVDPVLVSASPVSFINKPFLGTDNYKPSDIPPIDLLIITHDHWDHLDYQTMLDLKDRVKSIVCPLGVGAHLEYWGFDPDSIKEVDWNDTVDVDSSIKLTSLPARHFSGRGLTSNQSLWTAYMLQSSFGNLFLSGDTGYDTHFTEIKKQFQTIDFAVMENGQYNEDWNLIHLMPTDLTKAVDELKPKKFITVHNSKYALGRHAWQEPMQKIAQAAAENKLPLLTPRIGDVVLLRDSTQTFNNWWENAE